MAQTSAALGRIQPSATLAMTTRVLELQRQGRVSFHEKRTGKHDDNWSDWYADYIVREQKGEKLPQ